MAWLMPPPTGARGTGPERGTLGGNEKMKGREDAERRLMHAGDR